MLLGNRHTRGLAINRNGIKLWGYGRQVLIITVSWDLRDPAIMLGRGGTRWQGWSLTRAGFRRFAS